MPSNIRGTLFPLLQNETWDFDPYRGVIYKVEYEGLSLSNMDALRLEYTRNNVSCLMHTAKGVTKLEVNDNTNTFTLDTWQIVGNEERYDGLSHPTLTNLLSDSGIAILRSDLQQEKSVTDLIKDLVAAGLNNSTLNDTIGRFYSLQQRGSTDYRKSQYVLRHTTNAPNTYSANISDIGIDQIYSTAKLITETTNGGLWLNPLPNRLQYKIGAIPVPTVPANYFFGWLKSSSTETLAAYNRIEICTEYTLELWSTDYYQIF